MSDSGSTITTSGEPKKKWNDSSSLDSSDEQTWVIVIDTFTFEKNLETFIIKVINDCKVKSDIVIVYRDGVADSQLDAVYDHGVRQVVACAAKNVEVIFSVVQKRIKHHFVIQGQGQLFVGDKFSNSVDVSNLCFLNDLSLVHVLFFWISFLSMVD